MTDSSVGTNNSVQGLITGGIDIPPSLPPTPTLARKLFVRSDMEKNPPIMLTDEEKLCDGEPFHTTVSRLLFQALPSLKLETIDTTVKDFFTSNHITTEDGLSSLVPADDLPDKADSTTAPYWKIMLFRRAMSTIITGCSHFKLLPNTPYILLLQHTRGSSVGFPPGSPLASTTSKAFSVKTVAAVTLDPFSGLTSDFKEWHDSVANAYGICGHQCFLDDEDVCTQNDAVSYSIKCNISGSLRDGTLAYLTEEMKHERNAYRFLQGIRLAADEKADHRNREFKQWLDLFTQSLDKPDDCYSFINKFSLSISALKEAKSTAVHDDVLLRALLLQSIKCDEFAEIKLEITKDLDMKPAEIIKSLKAHQLALDSEEVLKEQRSGLLEPRQVRRGTVTDGKEKFGDTKPHFRIPRWPKGLYEVCTNSLWKQLSVWKMLVNKGNLNDVEHKKLNEFTIHHDRDGSDNDRRMSSTYTRRDRDGSDNDRHMSSTYARRDNRRDTRRGNRDDRLSPVREKSSSDNTRDNASSRTRFNLDNENHTPTKRSRSAMTNRHSDDKRRVRRRSVQYDGSSDDEVSASSDNSYRNSRRARVQYDPDIEDSSGRRILMGGALRN